MSTSVFIRVDASPLIGTGHVSRCLALADSFRQHGGTVTFLCRSIFDSAAEKIIKSGHRLEYLLSSSKTDVQVDASAYAHWLGVDPQTDADETIEKIGQAGRRPDWLIVDHYALDATWEKRIRPFVKGIFVIDDLANREHACDFLLDQNFHSGSANRYASMVGAQCRLLLGTRYALLRPEFHAMRATGKTTSPRFILAFMGGVDAANVSLKVIKGFLALGRPELSLDLIFADGNPHAEKLISECGAHTNIAFHMNVQDMAYRLNSSDIAIGAGGVAMWERCCVGVPAITIAVAENQEAGAIAAGEYGATLYLGRNVDIDEKSISHSIAVLCESAALRASLSAHASTLVDGLGCLRVTRRLMCAEIKLRPASAQDSEQLFRWRNDESVRKFSGNGALIKYEDHQRWFAAAIVSTNRALLIGEQSGQSLGVIRYDIDQDIAEISIYLVPGNSGKGIGTNLLEAGEQWLSIAHPEVQFIHAMIHSDNAASMKMFQSMEFYPYKSLFRKKVNSHV